MDIFCYNWQQYTTPETTDEQKNRRELYKKEKKREAERSKSFQLFESFMESAPQLLLQMYILAVNVSTASSSSSTNEQQCDGNCTLANNTTNKELIGINSLLTAAVNSSSDFHHPLIVDIITNDKRNLHSIFFSTRNPRLKRVPKNENRSLSSFRISLLK